MRTRCRDLAVSRVSEHRLESTIQLPDDIGSGHDCIIPVTVNATDPDGTRVFEADITMWVTPRKR